MKATTLLSQPLTYDVAATSTRQVLLQKSKRADRDNPENQVLIKTKLPE